MQMESVGSREIRTGGWQEMKMITFVDLSLVVVHNLNEKLTKPVNLSDDFLPYSDNLFYCKRKIFMLFQFKNLET